MSRSALSKKNLNVGGAESNTLSVSTCKTLPQLTQYLRGGHLEETAALKHIRKSAVLPAILHNLRQENWQDCMNFMCCCLQTKHRGIVKDLATPMLQDENFLNLESHPELVDRLLSTLIDSGRERAADDVYEGFAKALMKYINEKDILRAHATALIALIQPAVSDDTYKFCYTVYCIAEAFDWQSHIEVATGILSDIYSQLRASASSSPPTERRATAILNILKYILQTIQHPNKAEHLLPVMTDIYTVCVKADWFEVRDPDQETPCYKALNILLYEYFNKHQPKKPTLCAPILASLLELSRNRNESICRAVLYILNNVMTAPDIVVEDQVETFIDLYLIPETSQRSGLSNDLCKLFKKFPEPFHRRLDEFVMNLRKDTIPYCKMHSMLTLLCEMATQKPQAVTETTIETFVQLLQDRDNAYVVLQILQTLAEKRPKAILPYEPDIIALLRKDEDHLALAAMNVLAHLAAVGQAHAHKYTKLIVAMVDENKTGHLRLSYIHWMYTLAMQHPDVVAQHSGKLQEWMKQPTLAANCRCILDTIEGRSLGSLAKQVKKHTESMDDLDQRVTLAEDSIDFLTRQIGGSGQAHTTHSDPGFKLSANERTTTGQCSGCYRLANRLKSQEQKHTRLQEELESQIQEVADMRNIVQSLSEQSQFQEQKIAWMEKQQEHTALEMKSLHRQLREQVHGMGQLHTEQQQLMQQQPINDGHFEVYL